MQLDDEMKVQLGIALNEATLIGVEVIPDKQIVAVTLTVLSLPETGEPPEDPRVQILLAPVSRIAASLRLGSWNDLNAKVVPFEVNELSEVVKSFGNVPIYGWEFFDRHEEELAKWSDRLSLNWCPDLHRESHSLNLFQENRDRHLDILIWFDRITVRGPAGHVIPLSEFVAAGKRWWDGLDSGDSRTEGSGIFPLKDKS